ncbi:MAG: PilZ domain-containing protein [Lachnospiraceae bacterium]|nr:PilZ domain-containing protein [Lachnospiraceae bacterium]
MIERRKSKRTRMESHLVVKRLDNGKNDIAAIEVQDVSRTGVGFVCKDVLQIGSVYESFLTIWTKEVLHAFIQIVRIEMLNDGYVYGAVFIGMPEMEQSRISIYQTVEESKKTKKTKNNMDDIRAKAPRDIM